MGVAGRRTGCSARTACGGAPPPEGSSTAWSPAARSLLPDPGMHAGVVFHDRIDGGRWLAAALMAWRATQPVVVALARGGVPVGYEVARALGAPLDVLAVRKLAVPADPSLRVGALAEGGARYLDMKLIERLGLSIEQLRDVIEAAQVELARRVLAYRGDRAPIDLRGRTVLLVDDGLATEATARAAIAALRPRGPRAIVVAAPVSAPDTMRALEPEADAVVCARSPSDLSDLGRWYEDHSQTSEEEVRWCVDAALANRVY
jgi:putative phosphoribosyl transferase